MRNFCANKTTNEMFARRGTAASGDRSDTGSRTSSMLSVNTSMDEHQNQMLMQNRRCAWIGNCFQMCCN